MTRARPTARAGFTLIEVLAVMALIGAVLPVVMYAITTSTAAASLVHQRALASELAANELEEMVLGTQWQQLGATAGDVQQDALTYHWTATIEDWTAPNASVTGISNVTNVSQITVEVTWTGQGRPRSLTLTTLVYNGGNVNGPNNNS